MQLFIICHGNIARSQILAAYLEQALHTRTSDNFEIFSCATTESLGTFENETGLLHQVQEQLQKRGFSNILHRTLWNAETAKRVCASDVILVADKARLKEVLTRLGSEIREKTFLFYEFIGEGQRDFVDTYDPDTGKQHSSRFDTCFDELERIADRAADKLMQQGQ